MNYTISILTKKIAEHKQEIERLKKIDAESLAEVVFIESDIENHKRNLQELQYAVKVLLKTPLILDFNP